MPRQVEGRRVPATGDFEGPGDYCVVYDDGGSIISLWFSLPGFGQWGRILGKASPEDGPKWTITEDDEGRVTVEPSIKSEWTWGKERAPRLFHGHLRAGTWELLDDCVGAE